MAIWAWIVFLAGIIFAIVLAIHTLHQANKQYEEQINDNIAKTKVDTNSAI